MTDELDCPICCDPLTEADTMYLLDCPTPSCHYHYCVNCIQQFARAAADGYQVASDGSRQLKVHVCCPQCRAKYECAKYGSKLVVQAVLTLRMSHTQLQTVTQKDSELSATELAKKHQFLTSQSVESLKTAYERLNVYQKAIGKASVPEPSWNVWLKVLQDRQQVLASCNSGDSSQSSLHNKPAVNDPTLFYGLEELMSLDEQVYVTSLLTNGSVDQVFQAAFILHSILQLAAESRSAQVVRQMSSFGSSEQAPSASSASSVADIDKLRRRFTLPPRMPRCIILPLYDPNGKSSAQLLKFKTDSSLELTQVRGVAGRSGLRRGDVVTHVNGEMIHNTAMLQARLAELWSEKTTETFTVVVNADSATATALQERAEKMVGVLGNSRAARG